MDSTDFSHSHTSEKSISRRELAKDKVIVSLLPQGRLSIFGASAGKGVLATRCGTPDKAVAVKPEQRGHVRVLSFF